MQIVRIFGVCELKNLSALKYDGVVFGMYYEWEITVTTGVFGLQTSYIHTLTTLGLVGYVTTLYVRGSLLKPHVVTWLFDLW